ncbi:DUF423 domain-containing protein [Kurthia sibirica]|uniref:DUF423 domain-containing protein n=1 Tax=Kurthia sibirica TaxID=202750 RepID=A0A2U3AH53_9BACL|nr:DUF423 domain-containing protein [Kurthia sibirica]PWI23878.1 DUF423 domain-containing protein [Kurthia sibirica]GEK35047.1 DUF423 domain-containing protein [Kurthia sibirica]
MKRFIMTGGIIALLAVALGAFGAHALEDVLTKNDYVDVWETGVTYQMSHGIGLILIGILMSKNLLGDVKILRWAGNLLVVGTLLFSGSLYVLSLSGIKVLGAITPIGGVCFLAGWLLVIIAAKKFAK